VIKVTLPLSEEKKRRGGYAQGVSGI